MKLFISFFLFISSLVSQELIKPNPVAKGALFSAVLFNESELAEKWTELKPVADSLFPGIKIKSVCDLHMTVVYIGNDWYKINPDSLKKELLFDFKENITLKAKPELFGRNKQVLVLELEGIPDIIKTKIADLKSGLNKKGYKKPDQYDSDFRAHITLGELKYGIPAEDGKELIAKFKNWIEQNPDIADIKITIGPETKISLMLAGINKDPSKPEYIKIEDFINGK